MRRVPSDPDQRRAVLLIFITFSLVIPQSQHALALITGGVGNDAVAIDGWPTGAAVIFDSDTRIAWWEGPPFGGGQYHAECRGDTAAFNQALVDFGKLDVNTKRLVVHDGVGRSFWLNPNRVPDKEALSKIDWVFMVWNPANWVRLRKLPPDVNPTDVKDADTGPPAQIDVYIAGGIRWADVVVPNGIELIDRRLEAHGFTLADGEVVEGTVTDQKTKQPIAAQIRLQQTVPQSKGGYLYPVVAETVADFQGHWVLKNVPAGKHRVVAESQGYAPRVAGHGWHDGQPSWQSFDCGLSAASTVSGEVTVEGGTPLADVQVSLRGIASPNGERYELPNKHTTKTDPRGRFVLDNVPAGKGRIAVHKPGYCRPGPGQSIDIPADGIRLHMTQSASVMVTIDFASTERPAAYIVNIEPEDGSKIGTWGGSARIDAENTYTFKDVPPGRYTIQGHPNPTTPREKTVAVTIDLLGSQQHEVTLDAK